MSGWYAEDVRRANGTGSVRWTFDRKNVMSACVPAVAGDGETVYIGTWDRRVIALSVADGTVSWEIMLGEDWPFPARVNAIVASGDTLYAVLERNLMENGYRRTTVIAAIDRSTRRELWQYQAQMVFSAGATWPAGAGRLLVASAGLDDSARAFDRALR